MYAESCHLSVFTDTITQSSTYMYVMLINNS